MILKCTAVGERAATLTPVDGSTTRCCALKFSSAVRQQHTRQLVISGWWSARTVTRAVDTPSAHTNAGTETWPSMLLSVS